MNRSSLTSPHCLQKTIFVNIKGKVEEVKISSWNTEQEITENLRSLAGLSNIQKTHKSSYNYDIRLKDVYGLPLSISPKITSNSQDKPYRLDIVSSINNCAINRHHQPIRSLSEASDQSNHSYDYSSAGKSNYSHRLYSLNPASSFNSSRRFNTEENQPYKSQANINTNSTIFSTPKYSSSSRAHSVGPSTHLSSKNSSAVPPSVVSHRRLLLQHNTPQEAISQLEKRISYLECRLESMQKFSTLPIYSSNDKLSSTNSIDTAAPYSHRNSPTTCSDSIAREHSGHLYNPGMVAPPPNPDMASIRIPCWEYHMVRSEYRTLIESDVEKSTREELKHSTFNNWVFSDAGLLRLVRSMYEELKLIDILRIDFNVFDGWMLEVYRRYNRVPFHNFKHAFMVTQMMYSIINQAGLVKTLGKLDLIILITAAICHDLDHPGLSNAYQINAGTQLAMRYNDQSPLENHHSAMAFDIVMSMHCNIFCNLSIEDRRYVRDGMVKCILATDMTRHNIILSQFKTLIPELNYVDNPEHKDLLMMILIKVSDISNESRPLDVAGPWIDSLLEEFFNQSDLEKKKGLPITPFMDRDTVVKSSSQCAFIQFVILPLLESLIEYFPVLEREILTPTEAQLDYYREQVSALQENNVSITGNISSEQINELAKINHSNSSDGGGVSSKHGNSSTHDYTQNNANHNQTIIQDAT